MALEALLTRLTGDAIPTTFAQARAGRNSYSTNLESMTQPSTSG